MEVLCHFSGHICGDIPEMAIDDHQDRLRKQKIPARHPHDFPVGSHTTCPFFVAAVVSAFN